MLPDLTSHTHVIANTTKSSQNLSASEIRMITVSFRQYGVAVRLCNEGHHGISPILSVSKFLQERDSLKWSHQTLFFSHKCGENSVRSIRRTDIPSH